MIPLRLELSLQCVACHAPVALNAITPHVTCGSCGRTVSLGVERWRELLRAPLEEAAAMREGEQRDASFDSPEGVCRRVYRREPPRCVACADAIAPEAAAASAKPSGWLGCTKCRRSILTRALPTITTGVACFVGEDVDLAFDRAQPQKEPVAIACPSCGGALPADGSARVFACKFCQATVHLPDADLPAGRFHVVCSPRRLRLGVVPRRRGHPGLAHPATRPRRRTVEPVPTGGDAETTRVFRPAPRRARAFHPESDGAKRLRKVRPGSGRQHLRAD